MEAPVSASLGAIGSLPGKLDELLATERLALQEVVKGEIKQLRTDLVATQTLLLELSKAQYPPQAARYWMKDVRELSYDMDDWLDKLIQADDDVNMEDWIDKISGFKTRVEEAKKRYARYELNRVLSSTNTAIDHRLPTGDGKTIVGPVGMEGKMEELGRWLNSGEQQLKVASIVGFGGVGKSTLVQKLWREFGGQFDCRAFVRTAKKPDMRRILRSILSQVRPRQRPDACQVHNLIHDLREHLQKNRYLIIVDDLWATSVWDVVSRAFPEGDHCSRIIITTTIEDVALACCGYHSKHIFKMEPLSDDLSKKLFITRLFGSGKGCPQQFEDASDEITRKCGGLPLAIMSIAGLVASQPERLEHWKNVQNCLHSNLRTNPTSDEILKQVLNLCCNSLPHCLKTCLLYLGVYPENYTILKEDLVKQWVAEGFICATEGEDIVEVARNYFDELVNLGLIQRMGINHNDEVLHYAVHPTVLDLITYKSIEDNFITVIDYSQTKIGLSDKVRRLSLHFGSATYATTPASIRLSHVRSLSYMGLFNCMPSVVEFKLLRVAILHVWGDDANRSFDLTGICGLFRLVYLQIRCNITVKLPDEIRCLKHLETLEINARVAPGVSLQRFELPICIFSTLPEWIGQLRKLCILKIVVRELRRNDIDVLTGLPDLMVLSLYVRQPTAENIIFNRGAFPVLRYFKYMCGVLNLAFQEEAMPNLRKLKLVFNAHRGNKYGHMLTGIEHLLNLQEIAVRIGAATGDEESGKTGAESVFKDAISKHPFCPSFNVKWVNRVDEDTKKRADSGISQSSVPPEIQLSPRPEPEWLGKARSNSMENELQHTRVTSRDITFRLLEDITNCFSDEHKVGSGGYGDVYKGVLHTGEEIAVKKLHHMPGLDDVQFTKEFNHLMRVQHQNIVRLFGYCYEVRDRYTAHSGQPVLARMVERALCFEYLQGGSLDKHLSDESNGLDWHTRYNIVKGICEGLNYLHKGSNDPIYHLDLKPENILLDENMIPKIADFGLSRLFGTTQTHTTKKFIGTIGYMPPEYIEKRQISKKVDVFSLGVIIIQIMAGPMGYSRSSEMPSEQFVKLVHENWEKRLHATSTSKEVDSLEVKTCIETALRCVEADRVKRPTITEIIEKLNEMDTVRWSLIGQTKEWSNEQREVLLKPSGVQKEDLSNEQPGLLEKEHEEDTKKPADSRISQSSVPPEIRLSPRPVPEWLGKARSNSMENELHHASVTPRDLPFHLLESITNNFSVERKIGSGGYGDVYKGVLDGKEIAVKRLCHMPGFENEFENEFTSLMKVQHQNIVRLVGYCFEIRHKHVEHGEDHVLARIEERVLCFEYLHGGSLDMHLSDESCGLDWKPRYKLIKGICEGLNYLHGRFKEPLHLDLKPENILLDKNMVPKIANFGLSKLLGTTHTHITQNFIGTQDYMPPEYIRDRQISKKYDVFSLGRIIIEIMTGHKGYSKLGEMNSQKFINLVHKNWSNRIQTTSMPTSLKEVYCRQVKTCIEIALKCVEADKDGRPTIGGIIIKLGETETMIHEVLTQFSQESKQETMGEERGGEEKACLAKIGPWGGNGGKAHDIEVTPHRLESVTICCGVIIDSLAFSYIDRNGKRHTIGPWGGPYGNRHEIQFGPSEFLMEISGTRGPSVYSTFTVLTSLKFVTNEDAYSFGEGKGEGTPFSIPIKSNCSIVGFFGRAGINVHAIGVYVKPNNLTLPMSRGMVWNGKEVLPVLEETMEGGKEDKAGLAKIGPWGKNGGRALDIMVAPHHLETLTICSDVVVDSLEFSYYEFNGKRHIVGPWGGPGDGYTIRLSHSEFLTRVSGTVGPFDTLPNVITSITFYTNVGSYGPFGRGGGAPFDIQMQNNGRIVGFFGHAESCLEALGLYIRTH